MNKKIAVIGTGYVGLVSGTCFAETGNQVTCCDIDQEKIKALKQGMIPIYEPGLKALVDKNYQNGSLSFSTNIARAIREAKIVLIAVGTPMTETGEADLSFVKNVAKTIGENLIGYKVIVNKSTVPVGTGDMVTSIIKEISRKQITFDVVSNPEFLREGSAVQDTLQMERAVIGTTSDKARRIMTELHEPFTSKILYTDIESAEMIKYASNAFLATKISFINDIANICELVGADVSKVSEGVGLDSRIGAKFLQAGVGFGGSCFPKDTAALNHIAHSVGYNFSLMDAVMDTNRKQREKMIDKLLTAVGSLGGKTIAVLGLAFKPNTNDVRYAPAIDIVPKLIELGAKVRAYDPVATKEAQKVLGNTCQYFTDVYDAISTTDACIILTDWNEIKMIDLERVKEMCKQPIIVDGRNIFEPQVMDNKDFTYLSVGRTDVLQQLAMSQVI